MNLTYEQLLELSEKGANIHVHLGGGEQPGNGGGGDDDPGDPPQWIISSREKKGPRLYSPYQRSGKEPDRGGGLRIMLQTSKWDGKALILQETDKMLVIDGPTQYTTEAGFFDFYHIMSFRDEAGFAAKWLKETVTPPESHIFWVRKDQVKDV